LVLLISAALSATVRSSTPTHFPTVTPLEQQTERRSRGGKKKEKKSSHDEPFKAKFFNADILVCDEEDTCFRINEFAVSKNHTFNCHNNFIQIDFLLDPDNQTTKSSAYLNTENIAETDYVQSAYCTIIKM
jgi:hypothetical protein